MNIPERAREFVGELDQYSGSSLSNHKDLALLLGLAHSGPPMENLDRLAFLAKFAAKSRKIMERIGRNDQGYDKIATELANALDEIQNLLGTLTGGATDEERSRFSQTYLAKSRDGLANLFSLIADLAWYKNWTIDHRDWKLL
jgi:hypothetical protein